MVEKGMKIEKEIKKIVEIQRAKVTEIRICGW